MTVTTAPYIIQWAQGGPAGSQGVTLMVSAVGTPQDNALMFRAQLVSNMIVNEAVCAASAGTAPTGEQVFTFELDGDEVATVTFAAGETEGEFDFTETTWAAGVLTLTGPALISDPIADISITITGAQ